MKRLLAICIVLLMLVPTLGIQTSAQEQIEYKTFSFTVGTEEEKVHLLDKALWNAASGVRYADKNYQILYKYDLEDIGDIQSIELSGVIYQQLHLSVSTDGENYTPVYCYSSNDPWDEGLPEAKRTFILTDFVDLKHCQTLYVRLADAYPESGWGGAVRAKEPVELKVGYIKGPEMSYEKHSFTVCTEEEKSYLIKEGSVSGENVRYADGKNSFVYRFPIRNTVHVQKIELSGILYQQLHLSVSTDGKSYTTVYRYESADSDDHGLSRAKRTFDLTEYIDLTSFDTIYVSIADAYTGGGWGGAISPKEPVSLKVAYIQPTVEELNAFEMARTEHRVPVFGCNSEWGGGYVLDTTDQVAGYAALALTLRRGDALASAALAEPINAKGMDTLEFELYVSDTSVFDLPFSGYLTLSSAGREDAAALRWSMRSVLAAIEQKQMGWNHVVLPLSTASVLNGGEGSADLGAINYIGLGWTDMPTVPGNLLWKVDSFCLTDLQAVKREQTLLEHSWLIEQIRTLKELIEQGIDEDSFKTFARLTTNSRYELDRLEQHERSLLGELGLVAMLTEAQELVAAYEQQIVTETPVADEVIVPEPDDEKQEPEPELPEQPEQPSEPDDPIVEPQPSDNGGGYVVWIVAAAVIVLCAAAIAVWLLKRRK